MGTRRPYSPRKSAASSVRSKFRPKRPQKENEETRTPKEEKERLIEGKDVPETNRISTTFKDRFKLKELPIKKDDINKFLPEGYKPSTRTKANFNSDSLLRELLNKLKDKDLDKLVGEKSSSTRKFGSGAPTRNFSPESTTTRGSTKSVRISDSVTREDVSKFLPPGYKPSTTPEPDKLELNDLFKNVEIEPVELPASLLPPGFKPEPKYSSKNSRPKSSKVEPEEIPFGLLPKDYPKEDLKIEAADLPASLLPKGYNNKFKIEPEEVPASLLPKGFNTDKLKDIKIENADLPASLLPKDYRPDDKSGPLKIETQEIPASLLPKGFSLKPAEVDSSLLPKDYSFIPADVDASLLPKGYKPGATPVTAAPEAEVNTPKQIKLNFWPGSSSKVVPKAKAASAPKPVIPVIKSFVRTTTEFAGWPTTTTTTTTTPRPTTPGTCGDSCRLAATIRIVDGKKWSNSLLDPYTEEWQEMSKMVTQELEQMYLRSSLSNSFERVEVEAFSKGSIVVDYYVVFKELLQTVTTQDLKDTVEVETRQRNNDHMLGPLKIDAKKTDFIVVSIEQAEQLPVSQDEEEILPPWAVAVIVIGLASVAFVIVFGVSMLLKRRKISQGRGKSGKQAISLTEEMVYEMNRSGSASGYAGLDAAYHNYGMDMESWKSDKYSQGRFKRGSSSSSGGGTGISGGGGAGGAGGGGSGPYQSGLYDSWKTEWNPTYRDYQTTHYPHPTSSYMTKGGRRPSYEDDF